MTSPCKIRLAHRDDLPAMLDLQASSMRALGACHYAPDAIEAFIAFGTMDPDLVSEGSYFVMEKHGQIVATGGWSSRTPRYQAQIAATDAAPSDAKTATVRSLFVDPRATRQGLASRLMGHVENEILAAGFRTGHLTATLPGLALYRRLNWRSLDPITMTLPGGVQMRGLNMMKPLSPPSQVAA